MTGRLGFSIIEGDCRAVMGTLPAASVDAIVTDPPYGLSFMGKGWDHGVPSVEFWLAALRVAKPGAPLLAFGGTRTWHRLAVAIEDAGWLIRDTIGWFYSQGWPKSRGSLKPGWEPIILAAAPGAVVALNIEESRIAHASAADLAEKKKKNPGRVDLVTSDVYGSNRPQQRVNDAGRWPANVLLDEEAGALLDEQTGTLTSGAGAVKKRTAGDREGQSGPAYGAENRPEGTPMISYADSGGASRFFYCAKASRSERTAGNTIENKHPTVKPLALMRYLVKLVTPPDGVVLDPFVGSGTTGVAATEMGFGFMGIDNDPDSIVTVRARVARSWKEAS